MKKIIITLIGLLAANCPMLAEVWSLDSCISYALDNNLNIRQARLREHSGELSVTEAQDRYLPSLSAGASQQFSFGRGLTAENVYANRNTKNFGWNANLSLPLFQGLSAYRNEQYARASLKALVEETESARDDVTLNVMASYLQVLLQKELANVAEEQCRISAVELDRRQILLDNGKIAEVEVISAKSQLASDEVSLVTARNDVILAKLDLLQLLRLNEDVETFDVELLPDDLLIPLSAEDVYANALRNNHSMLAADLNVDAADKQISVAKSGYLPTLSFNAGIGSSYYNVSGVKNDSFGTQMRNNFATNLGFSLNIPIFDAFTTRNNVRRAQVSRLTAELNREQARDNLYRTIQQAYYQAIGAEQKMKSTEAAVTSTKATFDAMQEKYNYGRANATELEQAKSSYIVALAQHVQARYEASLRNRILAFYNKTN
ncbi:MAG: TolC family protein [Muribaculaceae bacterium]|nr:TolC family protein [Muribaculaceae bacterium]